MASQGAVVDRRQPPIGDRQSRDELGVRQRILIVEDHELLAEALTLALSGRGFDGRVAAPLSAESILAEARALRPHLVLLDLDLGTLNGLDLISRLRDGGAVVLMVTGCTDEALLAACLAEGALGWVAKSEPFERLVDAAEMTLQGRSLIPLACREELVELGRRHLRHERELASLIAQLTYRESEVLDALGEGKTAKDIADQFVVSVGTVRTHIRAILSKLGVSTQLAAVAKAGKVSLQEVPPARRHRVPRSGVCTIGGSTGQP